VVTDEEVAALEERLAEAEAEAERLQTIAADSEARAAHAEETLAQAKTELTSRDEELATLRNDLAAVQAELVAARSEAEELRAGLRSAAEKYRQAVLASQAEVPPDLVGGETVEEVDRQLEAAMRMVAQLKGHLQSQAQAQRVPTGAPVRRAPDLSALSPTEKISHGLAQKR
jgi:predicted RNase H-like nuclease (RuvC/YqgF family)